jgi:hypothetical protein
VSRWLRIGFHSRILHTPCAEVVGSGVGAGGPCLRGPSSSSSSDDDMACVPVVALGGAAAVGRSWGALGRGGTAAACIGQSTYASVLRKRICVFGRGIMGTCLVIGGILAVVSAGVRAVVVGPSRTEAAAVAAFVQTR